MIFHNIRINTRNTLKTLAEKGLWTGGKAPYGYRYHPKITNRKNKKGERALFLKHSCNQNILIFPDFILLNNITLEKNILRALLIFGIISFINLIRKPPLYGQGTLYHLGNIKVIFKWAMT